MKPQNNDLTSRILGQKTQVASTAPQVAETMMFPIAIDQIDEYESNPRSLRESGVSGYQGINPGTWRCDPTHRRYETPG